MVDVAFIYAQGATCVLAPSTVALANGTRAELWSLERHATVAREDDDRWHANLSNDCPDSAVRVADRKLQPLFPDRRCHGVISIDIEGSGHTCRHLGKCQSGSCGVDRLPVSFSFF